MICNTKLKLMMAIDKFVDLLASSGSDVSLKFCSLNDLSLLYVLRFLISFSIEARCIFLQSNTHD